MDSETLKALGGVSSYALTKDLGEAQESISQIAVATAHLLRLGASRETVARYLRSLAVLIEEGNE